MTLHTKLRAIFFLAVQIRNSGGPKKVRGPDFGKHCITFMKEKFPGNEASANQLKLIDGKMRRRNVGSLFYYKEIIKKIHKT